MNSRLYWDCSNALETMADVETIKQEKMAKINFVRIFFNVLTWISNSNVNYIRQNKNNFSILNDHCQLYLQEIKSQQDIYIWLHNSNSILLTRFIKVKQKISSIFVRYGQSKVFHGCIVNFLQMSEIILCLPILALAFILAVLRIRTERRLIFIKRGLHCVPSPSASPWIRSCLRVVSFKAAL